jgi:hypothetical protein
MKADSVALGASTAGVLASPCGQAPLLAACGLLPRKIGSQLQRDHEDAVVAAATRLLGVRVGKDEYIKLGTNTWREMDFTMKATEGLVLRNRIMWDDGWMYYLCIIVEDKDLHHPNVEAFFNSFEVMSD